MELPRRTQRGSKSISSRKSSNKSRSFYAVSVKLSKSTVYNPTLTVSKLMLQLRLLTNYFTLELINSTWTLNKGYQYRLAHPCVFFLAPLAWQECRGSAALPVCLYCGSHWTHNDNWVGALGHPIPPGRRAAFGLRIYYHQLNSYFLSIFCKPCQRTNNDAQGNQ